MKRNKIVFLLAFIIDFSAISIAQTSKLVQNNWIKFNIEELGNSTPLPDTSYIRYTLKKGLASISFYPAWDDHSMNYTVLENSITIGFQTYLIEELTDSTFTISAPGFKRLRFKSEAHLCKDPAILEAISDSSGVIVYRGNNTLTPRYKNGSLSNFLQRNAGGFTFMQDSYFKMYFTITEKGLVEDIKTTNSIAYGYDKGLVAGLKKTSGKWIPAHFNGKPVNCRISYELKMLKSSGVGHTSN